MNTDYLAVLASDPAELSSAGRVPGLGLPELTWFTDRDDAEEWAAEIRKNHDAAFFPGGMPRHPQPADGIAADFRFVPGATPPGGALLAWFLGTALGGRPIQELLPASSTDLATDALLERELVAEASVLCAELTARVVVMWLHTEAEDVPAAKRSRARAALLAGLETREGLARLLTEYPRLRELVTVVAGRWAESREELLQRLAADRCRFGETFGIKPDAAVVSLRGAFGDRHNRGRTAHKVTFSDGRALMYKPRSLAIDNWWADLCAFLRARGIADIHCAKTDDRDTYGWQEFLHADPAGDPRSYITSVGALAAVTTLMSSIDLHHENIVATGDRVAIIDCETLLTAAIPSPHADAWFPPDAAAMNDSVANLLILPGVDPNIGGVENSALLGGLEEVTVRARRLVDDDEGVRYETRDVVIPRCRATPLGTDGRAVALGHEEEFINGYRRAYEGMAKASREGVLQPFLERAGALTIRYVPRPTRNYAAKLSGSSHPNVLRDRLGPDIVLSSLWTASKGYRPLRRLMVHEHRDLVTGDIPYFSHDGGSVDLRSSDGSLIENYFDRSAVDRMRDRLRSANDSDLRLQCAIISSSFACERARGQVASTPANVRRSTPRPSTRVRSWTGAERRDLARRVAARIASCVHSRDNEKFAFGVTAPEPGRWITNSAGVGLYDGLSGIALTLATLSATYDLPEYHQQALDIYDSAVRQTLRADLTVSGAHSGVGGVLWTGAVLAARHGARFGRWAPRLLDLLERDRNDAFDVVSGLAGSVLAGTGVLQMHPTAPWAARLNTLTAQAARHLVASAQVSDGGVCWPSVAGAQPLIGFAHGSAGALYALERARDHGLLPDLDPALITGTLAWDDAHKTGGYWPDLRVDGEEAQSTMSAWCHGAPGIALGRAAWRSGDDGAGLATAVELMRSSVPGDALNLCHGLLGNSMVASRLGHRGAIDAAAAADVHDRVYELVDRCGGPTALVRGPHLEFRTGMAPQVTTPGLMTGLGGLGYWLALQEDHTVPDVLTLEP